MEISEKGNKDLRKTVKYLEESFETRMRTVTVELKQKLKTTIDWMKSFVCRCRTQ